MLASSLYAGKNALMLGAGRAEGLALALALGLDAVRGWFLRRAMGCFP
jgi:hypothetical protein